MATEARKPTTGERLVTSNGPTGKTQPPLGAPVEPPKRLSDESPVLPSPRPDRPKRLGRLGDTALLETSGLAVSQADDRVLWAINDSGQTPELYALDLEGGARGRWTVSADNRDWEDLDSAYLNGSPMLIIADTGDNLRRRPQARLWLLPEPEVANAPSTRTIEAREFWFRYADGPRNVEAMALADDAIWLISKEPLSENQPRPARVYQLKLVTVDSEQSELAVASFETTMQTPPHGLAARLAASLVGVDLNQPTALDIDESRGVAWVLTYQEVRRFDRQGQEPWSDTLARKPAATYRHGLEQAEALAVTAGGLVVYTSEGRAAPLNVLPPNWR